MYRIAVMPGDGTGPEVIHEGLKVLKAVSEKANFTYETVQFDFGGSTTKKPGKHFQIPHWMILKVMTLYIWVP